MSWALVIIAGLFEVAMTYCMKQTEGFSNLWWTIAFIVTSAISFILLTIAVRSVPLGSAYATWTGIGSAGTALIGVVIFHESADLLRLGSIALIILGVIGLQLGGGH